MRIREAPSSPAALWKKAALAWLLASVLCIAPAARASVTPDLDTLLAQAPAAVVATCTSVKTEWNKARTRITTTATFEADRVLRGGLAAGPLAVEQVGGTVGDITQIMVGAPSFAVGERSLLLLAPIAGRDAHQVYGLAGGKHRVLVDPRTGRERVVLRGAASVAGPEPPPGSSAAASHRLSGEVPLEIVVKALSAKQGGAR
jgi:hypothetical protein